MAVWGRVLSYNIRTSVVSNLGRLWRINSRKSTQRSTITGSIYGSSMSGEPTSNTPWWSQKTVATFKHIALHFLRRGRGMFLRHWGLLRLGCHLMRPCFITNNDTVLECNARWWRIRCSRGNPIRVALCSSVSFLGAQRAHVFLYPSCSYTILCALSIEVLSSSAVWLRVVRRPLWSSCSFLHLTNMFCYYQIPCTKTTLVFVT